MARVLPARWGALPASGLTRSHESDKIDAWHRETRSPMNYSDATCKRDPRSSSPVPLGRPMTNTKEKER
jgi:hypothetical protein